MRNLNIMILLGLALSGCTGECDDQDAADCVTETDVDTDTDTDTDSDTDTDADADMATISGGGFINGVAEDCQINFDGTESGSFNTADTDSVAVKAGSYRISIGTGDCGGVGCHTGSDGKTRVAPDQEDLLDKDDHGDYKFDLALYFDGEWDCDRENFMYDASKPDFKGQQRSDNADPRQRIQVVNGKKLKAYSDSNMNMMDLDDYLEVRNDNGQGDHFVLVEVGENPRYTFVSESSFSDTSFSLILVETDFGVNDVICELQ